MYHRGVRFATSRRGSILRFTGLEQDTKAVTRVQARSLRKPPWQAPFKARGNVSIPIIQRELKLRCEINYDPLPKICSILPERLAVRKSHRRPTWHGQPFQHLLGMRDRGATPTAFLTVRVNERTPLLNGYLVAEKPWPPESGSLPGIAPTLVQGRRKDFTFGRRL